MSGDQVTIYRHDSTDGYTFSYSGTLTGDGTSVYGTVSGGGVQNAPWHATIAGYAR